MENEERQKRWFSLCLALLLAATLGINLLSAYIRHQEAGLGCEPWPVCYARIGALIEPPGDSPAAALTPTDTVKRAHRALATGLVILVLLVVYYARQQNLPAAARPLPYAIVAVILLLAVVGPASYMKTLPAIATVNLAGGMALLGLTWTLLLLARCSPQPAAGTSGDRARLPPALLVKTALLILSGQILLGAWLSANFAAAACSGFLNCDATEGAGLLQSFWYLRELSVAPSGAVLTGGPQSLIALAHHWGAVVTLLLLSVLGVACVRAGGVHARWGGWLMALVALQGSLGVIALYLSLPLLVVLGHDLVAALLLLVLLRLLLLPSGRKSRPAS